MGNISAICTILANMIQYWRNIECSVSVQYKTPSIGAILVILANIEPI